VNFKGYHLPGVSSLVDLFCRLSSRSDVCVTASGTGLLLPFAVLQGVREFATTSVKRVCLVRALYLMDLGRTSSSSSRIRRTLVG
jgi:hypothetical protein